MTAELRPVTRTAIMMASAAAVEPSYIDALATSMPVSSQIILWNSKIACNVPCEIFSLIGRVRSQKFTARNERVDNHGPVVVVGARAEKHCVAFAVLSARCWNQSTISTPHLAGNLEVALEAVSAGMGKKDRRWNRRQSCAAWPRGRRGT